MNTNYDDVIASLKQSLPTTWHILGVENKNGEAELQGQPVGIFLGAVSVTGYNGTNPISGLSAWRFLKLIEDYYEIAVPLHEICTQGPYPYLASHFLLQRIGDNTYCVYRRTEQGVMHQNNSTSLNLMEEHLRDIVEHRRAAYSTLQILPQPIEEELAEYI